MSHLDQPSVVEVHTQVSLDRVVGWVEHHQQSLLLSQGVNMKPGVNVLHRRSYHMNDVSVQYLPVILVELDPVLHHRPGLLGIVEMCATVAGSNPATEVLAQTKAVGGEVVLERFKHSRTS